MSFVDQQPGLPVVLADQGVQQGGLVEHPVDVGHHQIAPAGHFLGQEVGADFRICGNPGEGVLGQYALVVGGGLSGARQSVKKAFGQRAGIAVAGLVRVFAGMILGHQFQRPDT